MMQAQDGAGSFLLFITPLLFPYGLSSELSVVTCGSVLKILNTKHNVRLHSHDVRYGSGSGQQSVTGVLTADDGNSYWRIRGKTSTVCERGTLVKCGQSIRLTHINTGRNLHSHHFTSPLSGNQEVSAFGDDGEGDILDDWTVLCNGEFWQRDEELRAYPEKFQNYFRMSASSFDGLLHRLSGRLQRQDTQLRRSISPEERLSVTLRFLATGESMMSLHYQFRLGRSTIGQIVLDTCQAIWEVMKEEFLPEPTEQLWLQIAEKFLDITQFPNCVGAVDGKHVRIQKPARTGSQYYNYKRYFSMILMAVADAEYRFIAVDIGAYGRTNDSRVLKESNIGQKLYHGNFNFPAPRPLPGTEGPPMPFVMVADEAFQMCTHLIKPYPSRRLDDNKRIFNYRLSRARRFVECAFGLMSEKWRILHKAIQLKPESVDEIIKACVILHNYVITNEPTVIDDHEVLSSTHRTNPAQWRTAATVHQMRDTYAEYFVSEAGRVEWQDRMI